MKAKVKRKQAVVRRSTNLTGGGSPSQLTAEEEQVLTTISESAVVGHLDSQESQVTFFNSMTESNVSWCVPEVVPEQIFLIDPHDTAVRTSTVPAPASPNYIIEIKDDEPQQKTHRDREQSEKKKRTTAQTRLQKSLDVAVALEKTLKKKNAIQQEFLIEMRKQSDAMNRQAEALSRQADSLERIAKCKAARASFFI